MEKKKENSKKKKPTRYGEGGNQFIFVYYSFSVFYVSQGLPVNNSRCRSLKKSKEQ